MAGIDDFKAAIASLKTQVQGLPAAIAALIAAHNNDDDAAFEAASKDLTDIGNQITSATSQATDTAGAAVATAKQSQQQ